MEIRCSETNRMGQELRCGLKSEGTARTLRLPEAGSRINRASVADRNRLTDNVRNPDRFRYPNDAS